MTQARGVVDVMAAEKTRGFLRRVIDLVRDAARRQIERQAARIDPAKLPRNAIERFIPRHHREAILPLAPYHRLGQPAERAQLLRRFLCERRDV